MPHCDGQMGSRTKARCHPNTSMEGAILLTASSLRLYRSPVVFSARSTSIHEPISILKNENERNFRHFSLARGRGRRHPQGGGVLEVPTSPSPHPTGTVHACPCGDFRAEVLFDRASKWPPKPHADGCGHVVQLSPLRARARVRPIWEDPSACVRTSHVTSESDAPEASRPGMSQAQPLDAGTGS